MTKRYITNILCLIFNLVRFLLKHKKPFIRVGGLILFVFIIFYDYLILIKLMVVGMMAMLLGFIAFILAIFIFGPEKVEEEINQFFMPEVEND